MRSVYDLAGKRITSVSIVFDFRRKQYRAYLVLRTETDEIRVPILFEYALAQLMKRR